MKLRLVQRVHALLPSPPSRGAWIEIRALAEIQKKQLSPPSRGAWIEMLLLSQLSQIVPVAPLAGGVD